MKRNSAVLLIIGLSATFTGTGTAAPSEADLSGVSPNPPALDAAYGTPSAGAEFTPDTTAEPGYIERSSGGVKDTTMGPSTSSVDAEGNVISGYTVFDESVEMAQIGQSGEPPQYHTVEKGDTLWAISRQYLSDPYAWPKLWSYNEQITNAHWIFPGDRIRLRDPYDRDEGGEAMVGLELSKTRIPVMDQPKSWVLHQTAFVSADEFDSAMDIIGGAEAKVMMATLDTVYMSYPPKAPPIPGERLVAYTPQAVVRDLKGKKILGYVVEIVGEVDVLTVEKKASEGVVAFALNPLERGYKVGPLRRRYHSVTPVPGERDLKGRVVATLTSTGPIYDLHLKKKGKKKRKTRRRTAQDVLAGEEQWVIHDLGGEDGVRVGHVFEVVRKGDDYTEKRVFKVPYEEGWPRRVIGTVLVVDVQPETSLGFVTWSEREIERGEHVELLGSSGPADRRPSPGASGPAPSGHVSGEAKPGKIRGRAGVRIGG